MGGFALLLAIGCVAPAAQAPAPWATPLRAGAIFPMQQIAGWQVNLPGGGRYRLLRDNLVVIAEGTLDAAPVTLTQRPEHPGMLRLELTATDGGQQVVAAAIQPDRIRAVTPEPRDFDRFWSAQRAAARRVPLDAQVTAKPGDREGVLYATLRLRHPDGGHVQAQLARPAQPGRYPALVIFQWAGRPYPLLKEWVTARAAEGWLVLNVQPHDVPVDAPQSYYDALPDALKNYQHEGRDDRLRNYFRRMYLGDARAVDWLTSRDDWDGRQLVAMGTSMGGQQALCTAALEPRITAVLAHVPAGADQLGPLQGRAAGYPNWPADDPAVQRTAPYFDLVNCAARVRVPALVSMGFLDTVTPAVGIWAAFNRLRGPKEAVPLPEAAHNHQSTAEQQAAWTRRAEQWLAMLRAGQNPAAAASVPQPRLDANSLRAHEQLLAKRRQGRIDVYLLGDSITRRWGAAEPRYASFLAHFRQTFHGWNAANFGWGADRTQNMLWRLQDGELDDVNPRVIVLMAGTNNIGARRPAGNDEQLAADVVRGVAALVEQCRRLAPRARIVLMGITPRADDPVLQPVITLANARLRRLADGRRVHFIDLSEQLSDADGRPRAALFEPDLLHLALPGYQVWADALRPVLREWLGPPAAEDLAPPPTGDPAAMASAVSR